MNKYNGLLSSVAHKYHICKGARETENEWKTRLVYSICGMMAYASLWDDSEEGTISIVHLKRKVRSMLANYKSMYPELSGSLPYVSEELEDEIADQFLSTGVVYHRPNRIVPSMKHEEPFGDILFQRGIALDSMENIQHKSALIPSDEIRSEELLAEQKFEAFITSLAHIIEKYGMRVLGEVDGAA